MSKRMVARGLWDRERSVIEERKPLSGFRKGVMEVKEGLACEMCVLSRHEGSRQPRNVLVHAVAGANLVHLGVPDPEAQAVPNH